MTEMKKKEGLSRLFQIAGQRKVVNLIRSIVCR